MRSDVTALMRVLRKQRDKAHRRYVFARVAQVVCWGASLFLLGEMVYDAVKR